MLVAAFLFTGCPNKVTVKPEMFAVTFSAGEHGTVKATIDSKPITSGGVVQKDKTVTFTAEAHAGYDVEKWTVNSTTVENTTTASYSRKITAKTEVKVFFKPSGDTRYTVKHLQEGLDGKYIEVEADVQTLTGTTGKNTEATAKNYTGFITPATVDQKPIAADGSTVIEIKYARKEITFTFNLAGGNINGKTDSVTVTGKYEEAVTKPANPTKTGYTFSGWNPELPNKFPAEDATYTAQWAREGDYTITYNLNDGTDNGGNPASYNVETATITLNPAGRKGYDFIGWYEKADFSSSPVTQIVKGSTGNKTFWAKWEPKTDTRYTVKHFKEKVTGGYDGVQAEIETLAGTTGKNTEATAKTYTGFITPTVDQKPIAADGSTVIEIKYARKEITFTFNLAGGTIDGKTDSVTVKGKYGEAVTKPANPKKDGYTFSGWNPELPETFPAENATYTAQWAKLHPVTFSVEGTPPNGTLAATLDGKPFTGGDVAEGKTVEFMANDDEYAVGNWTVTPTAALIAGGQPGESTAKVKITAATTVKVTFSPYKKVAFEKLDGYLKTANAASDGIYYIEVTGLTPQHLQAGYGLMQTPLGRRLKENISKKVALKLGSITDFINMSWCFSGCTNLVQVLEIPNNVTEMSFCFFGCTSLTQAPEIPSSVTNMSYCFKDCTSLTQAPEIPSSVTNMSYCFFGCTSLTQAPVIPDKITDMSSCFSGCKNLTQAPEIPNSVTNMSFCFYGCKNLTQAPVIPDEVTHMNSCFSGCTKLTSVTLKCNYPSSAADADAFKDAFGDCHSLTANSIKVPAGQLSAYQGGASNMRTTADRFVAE